MSSEFPSAERFGNDSLDSLDKYSAHVPPNTIKSRNSIWKQFMDFCQHRNYIIDSSTPTEKVAEIMKDYACNMRKSNGTDYRPAVVKCMWNTTAKILQDLFHKNHKREIDPFRDYAFKSARDARDAKRKLASINVKVVHISTADLEELIDSLDEDTPTGLQKKFYLVARQALSWRRNEAASCLVSYFTEEFTLEGKPTGRIQYNPRFLETPDVRPDFSDAKWLVRNNENPGRCPVRLLKKLLSKRVGIKSNRLFLIANGNKKDNCICPYPRWFKDSHVGKNEIGNWEKNLPRIKNPRADVSVRESGQELQEELQTTTSSCCSQSDVKLEEISITETSVLESSTVSCKEEPLEEDSESSLTLMECESNILPPLSGLEQERDKPDDQGPVGSPVSATRYRQHRIVDLHYVINWSLTVQHEHNQECNGKLKISKENSRGLLTEITLACDSCNFEVTKSTENNENIARLSAIEDALSKTRSLLNELL